MIDPAILIEIARAGAGPYAYRRSPGECAYCDQHRTETMMPSHTPSKNCQSGKHPHCTCDVCF